MYLYGGVHDHDRVRDRVRDLELLLT